MFQFHFLYVAVSYLRTTYWSDCLFPIAYSCLLCHRLGDHRCIGLSLDYLSFSINLYFSYLSTSLSYSFKFMICFSFSHIFIFCCYSLNYHTLKWLKTVSTLSYLLSVSANYESGHGLLGSYTQSACGCNQSVSRFCGSMLVRFGGCLSSWFILLVELGFLLI